MSQDTGASPYETISKNICCVDLCSKYNNRDNSPLTEQQRITLIEEFKTSLRKNNPIFYGVLNDKNFDNDSGGFIATPNKETFLATGGKYSPTGGHAFAIVGYGNYNPEKPDVNYFKFINCWGAKLGG